MIEYLTALFSRTFNQLLILFGGVLLLAVALWFVSTGIRDAGEKVMGYGYYYLVAPGVVCHETGHALGCILTGTEILEYKAFEPRGDTLGYVSYSSHQNKILAYLSDIVIASGPIWFGCFVIWLLSRFLGRRLHVVDYDVAFQGSLSPSTWEYCICVLKNAFALMVNLCRIWNWKSTVNAICFYLLLCIVSEMTLSLPDTIALIGGMAAVAVVVLSLNAVPVAGVWFGRLVYRISRKLFAIHVLMTFVLLIDILFFVLIACPIKLLID